MNETSAKNLNKFETTNEILNGLSGLSSIQSGKTGFQRIKGIAQMIGSIATLSS